MSGDTVRTAFLHYSAPPVVGGVEAVMDAHARIFLEAGYPVTIVAGQGDVSALPEGCELVVIPELDSQHPAILTAGAALEEGTVPDSFDSLTANLREQLAQIVGEFDNLIVHNVFTKHFNLPLTAALWKLLDAGQIKHCVGWHHDFTWTSPRSRSRVHNGYPWDLLRTFRPDMTNVTISKERRDELAGLYQCPPDAIEIIYNGVDPREMFGLTVEGWALCERLGLLEADLLMLMPVRVTRAKNIEFALEVISALNARGLAIKLVLTGPPDPHDEESMTYFRSLQARRDALGLGDAMHFVYESGPDPNEAYLISLDIVADLYRVADLLFMPSHQEGFGMPVLEAGLLSLPVVASSAVPAAIEIGGDDVLLFDVEVKPAELGRRLARLVAEDGRLGLARRTRQNYTWSSIFRHEIEPLLHENQNR
jgi:glycosyltransferase involved in cell wall biosynthesis